MEQSSFFNDLNGDREYDAEQFATYFRQFLSNGLYHRNNVPALLVSKGEGITTKMEPGSAYIEGYMYLNTEPIIFNHGVSDNTNPRIDRIVLRLDRSVNVRAVNAVVKMGVPATNPQPPVLERNDVIYEISLSQVRINAGVNLIYSIKDERLDPTVAGLVSSLITAPTDGFIQDWNYFMTDMEKMKTDWKQGIDSIQQQYIQELELWMADINAQKQTYYNDWATWFANIQKQNYAMGGMNITVGPVAPTNPTTSDIWIDTNA